MSDLTDDEIKEWEDTEEERQRNKVGGIACRDLMRAVAEVRRHRATQAASAERVRAVVRLYAIRIIGGYLGAGLSSASTEAVADAIAGYVAAQLTAPPPGHVCPVPYGLGPEHVDALSELAVHAEMADWPRAREALDKILAAHRPPAPAVGPLPEVIACGTEGCVSSIKKSYLPSGWLLCEGTWRCPRCKVVATTEAS